MSFIETHFAFRDLMFIAAGFLFFAGSLIAFLYKRYGLALLLLVAGGAALRIMLVLMDPFLHSWDEQFHALVARNLSVHPLHPTLIDQPVLPYDPKDWTQNHTWLHKPPFFLWLMAGSIKLFGANVLAVRLPTLLFSILLVPLIYRTGSLLRSRETGFIAALFYAASGFQAHLVAGQLNTDHNDFIFFGLVVLACWALCEYAVTKTGWRFALLCGFFSGCAILTKYLPGLLPLGMFGLLVLLKPEWRTSFLHWKHLAGAGLVCAAVVIPWHVFARMQWPAESAFVSEHYSAHLQSDFGHPGSWYFHLQELIINYGWWFTLLIVPGFILLLRQTMHKALVWSIGTGVLLTYVFYSFVPIRMPLFCLPVSFFLFICAAAGMEFLFSGMKLMLQKKAAPVVAGTLFALVIILANLSHIEFLHCDRDGNDLYRQTRLHNKAAFEKIDAAAGKRPYVLFNCSSYTFISAMFYTGQTAYHGLPDEAQFQKLKNGPLHILILDDGHLPAYIRAGENVELLPDVLMRNKF